MQAHRFASVVLLISLILGAPAAVARASATPADAIFTDGNFYTANPKQPWARAVAARGDRIVYVGGVAGVWDAGNFGWDDEVLAVISRWDREGVLPLRYHATYTLFLPDDLSHAIERGARAALAPPRSERLRVDSLVNGYTRNAAFQLRRSDPLGSIEVGKRADLVVLDRNPLDVDRYDIHKARAVAVMMVGRLVHGELSKAIGD